MKAIYNVKKHNAVFSRNIIMFDSENPKYDYLLYCPKEYSLTFNFGDNLIFQSRPPVRMFKYFLLWAWHISILRKDAFVSKGLIDID